MQDMANNNNIELVSNWHLPSPPDIMELEDKVCLGDRLEFDRAGGLYAHWGIYVGRYHHMKHAVIHFGMFEGGPAFSKKKISGSASSASQKPEIRADTIWMILGGSGKVRINNSRDSERQLRSSEAISEKAKKMHRDNKGIKYDFLDNNCEHFVNLCRYGKPHSSQAAKLTIIVILVILAALGVFVYMTSSNAQPDDSVTSTASWTTSV
ncbi:phospholipase A and acyltransferase 1-like [Patiria miniata]|uniref:LRAT domain-containing protein n=1 Tax=Patiria miniata TaxID=46514 RepID=A0A913Z719_PATMI|nr:phospholipase A and acyltransferase 1-like [Patiria miniata]